MQYFELYYEYCIMNIIERLVAKELLYEENLMLVVVSTEVINK